MNDSFYTSTQAREVTGCSRRQLQWWREKGIIVPAINPPGKGHHVYYSTSDLVALTLMAYFLSLGFSSEFCQRTLAKLKSLEPKLFEFEFLSKLPPDKAVIVIPALPEEKFETPFPNFEDRRLIVEVLDQGEMPKALFEGAIVIPIFFRDIYNRLEYRLRNR